MKQFLVNNRLRIMRGQSFVGMLFSTFAVVGIWRDSLPDIPWWVLCIILGGAYLTLAWSIGYVDEVSRMAQIEQGWYADRNPRLDEILEIVTRIEGDSNGR